MAWSNNSHDSTWTPCDAHMGVIRALHGNLQCFSYPTGTIRGPYRTWICKNPARASYVTVGSGTDPLRSTHGRFTGGLRCINPCGARKLIMHTLKFYGPRTGRQNRKTPHGTVRAPWVDVRFLFKTSHEESGNSPHGPWSVIWLRLKQGTIWNILRIFCFTSCILVGLFYLLDPCLLARSRKTVFLRIFQDLKDTTQQNNWIACFTPS